MFNFSLASTSKRNVKKGKFFRVLLHADLENTKRKTSEADWTEARAFVRSSPHLLSKDIHSGELVIKQCSETARPNSDTRGRNHTGRALVPFDSFLLCAFQAALFRHNVCSRFVFVFRLSVLPDKGKEEKNSAPCASPSLSCWRHQWPAFWWKPVH